LNFWLDAAYPPEYPATSDSGASMV
jgi:hypothetical protein